MFAVIMTTGSIAAAVILMTVEEQEVVRVCYGIVILLSLACLIHTSM